MNILLISDTLTSDLDILDKVSTKFTKSAWEQFRDGYLLIEGCEIEKVLPLFNSNVHDTIYGVLRLWVKKNNGEATASNLLQAREVHSYSGTATEKGQRQIQLTV